MEELTSDKVIEILVDEITERTPRHTDQAADDFRVKLQADIAYAKERGWVVEVPEEWASAEKE